MWIIVSVFKIVFTLICFQSYHSSSYSVFDLVCWFVAFFSHAVERFGEFIVVSFVIYRKFVGVFLLGWCVLFMLYYMLLKFSLVYLTVLILVVLLILIFWEVFLGGWLILRFSFMVCFLSFVHLVKLFELFWLVCLVSVDLMFQVLYSGHYCREWYNKTLTF